MYANRNTIYLLIALVAIVLSAMLLGNRLKKQQEKIAAKHKQLEQQFTESDNIAKTLPNVQTKFDSLQARWLYAPKKILALPEPQLTVSYMVWLTRHYHLDIPFEFKIDDIQQMDIISYFTFTLSGESNYNDLYTFIHFMTQNPLLYKFEKFNLMRNETKKIAFEVQMKGFFLQKEILPGAQFNFTMYQAPQENDKFYDIFYTTYTPPSDELKTDVLEAQAPTEEVDLKAGLVDPAESTLLALTSTTAYVLSGDGVMKRLKPGEKVYGGRFMYINQEKSEAQFQMSDGKQIRLGLGYAN